MTERIRRVKPAEAGAQVERRTIVAVGRAAGEPSETDAVAVEEPLEIRVRHGVTQDETSLSITMRTPGADEALAVGFLYGEGLIGGPRDVVRVEPHGPLAPGRSFHNVVRADLAPELAFQIRTLLIHEYRKNALRDPRLPEALLPADWQGYAAYQLCRNLYARVALAGEAHLDEYAQTFDGPLPPPVPAFYERFGGVLSTAGATT